MPHASNILTETDQAPGRPSVTGEAVQMPPGEKMEIASKVSGLWLITIRKKTLHSSGREVQVCLFYILVYGFSYCAAENIVVEFWFFFSISSSGLF